MEFLRIVGLSIASAIAYGLIHDQITARVCLEYFTIGHPRMFQSDSPTLHALYWGVVATWWVGLLIGLPLAVVSRAGGWPKLTWRNQLKPIGYLLAAMAMLAAAAGLDTYYESQAHTIGGFDYVFYGLPVPVEKRDAFMADFAAHNVSYAVGFAGGIILLIVTIVRRALWQKAARVTRMVVASAE